ncbi:MAG: hypothetical protein FJ146_09045 [Deltaproteobacteria bacterium]|nr:hypothetical protein [Deltaproteobacteria bacterium]
MLYVHRKYTCVLCQGWLSGSSFGHVGIGTTAPFSRLQLVTNGNNSTDGLSISSPTSGNVMVNPSVTAGAYNPLAQLGDSEMIFSAGSINTGAMVIGPWSSSSAGMRMTSNGNVGIGSDTPTAKLDVAGDLKVSGKYFGSKSGVGYVQPASWSYSIGGSGTVVGTFWSGNITVPQDSIIQVTLNGHWEVTANACYISIGIDDVSVDYPCSVSDTSCWGWSHTYSTLWESIAHNGYAKITAGTHKLSVMGLTNTNTCYLNGARLSYMYFPQ